MKQVRSRSRMAALAVALALGAALGNSPVQANDTRLMVSATILPRIACNAAVLGVAGAVSAEARVAEACSSSKGAATYRVRRDGGQPAAQGSSAVHAGTMVLVIEP